MNKSSDASFKNIDLNEDWSSHSLIDWLSSNKKMLLWSFLTLFGGLILAYRFIAAHTLSAENDFFQAQTLFNQFQQASISPSEDSSASSDLQQLEAIMQRHPELKPRYEGSLAQTTLIIGQMPQAEAFSEEIFKRVQPDHLSLYQSYTQASLSIGKGLYQEALQQAQQLQITLDELNENAHPVLYVFNLIRLGMLYQQLGLPKEELHIWEQLQNQPHRLEAVLAANQVLKIGQASFHQYIEERKKNLTP